MKTGFRLRHLACAISVVLITMCAVIVTVNRYRLPRWLPLPYAGLFVIGAARLPKRRVVREPPVRGRELVGALEAALGRERISGKQAAALKGQDAANHSLEMGMQYGRSPRLTDLGYYPDDVLRNLIEEMGKLLRVFVVRESRMAALIQKVEALPDVVTRVSPEKSERLA